MILKLSVFEPSTGREVDAEVTALDEHAVGDLLNQLPIPIAGRSCFVGSARLDPRAAIGDSPLVNGVIISIGAPGREVRAGQGSVGAIQVTDGPDAGVVACLPIGTHLIGGEPAAALWLRHARAGAAVRLTVQADRSAFVQGAPGLRLNGVAVTGAQRLTPEARVQAGETGLRWTPLPGPPAATVRSPDGRLDFDRAFAPTPPIVRSEVRLPARDDHQRNVAALLLSTALPIALAVVIALLYHNPMFLLFAALGPLGAVGTIVTDRFARRRRRRRYEQARRTAEKQIADLVADEVRRRQTLTPDRETVILAAVGATRGLWPRNLDSPNALLLRVGTADLPASIDLRPEPTEDTPAPVLPDVPVTVDLRETGVLGVVGSGEAAVALLRWLLLQVTVLRSPDDLRLVLISQDGDARLAWASWLPHTDASEAGGRCWIGNTQETRAARTAELRELVAARLADPSLGRTGPEVVVVLTQALQQRSLPGMKDILRDGPSVGVYVICADEQDMNECRGLCQVVDASTVRVRPTRADDEQLARLEGIGRDAAVQAARAVAPMRDRLMLASVQGTIPHPVRLLDLYGLGIPAAADVVARWRATPGPVTRVLLGADASGPVHVDLVVQGPHTMLGGATGAGKSILLRTLVASLLLNNRPDELNLVLVDFKGGSAFEPFRSCPHVVSLIRSTGQTVADVFDEAAAARVLASLATEVRRRESRLVDFNGEIDEYWRARAVDPSLPPLPRLVLIFDEFARVLEVSRDFLTELVNVAAKGRSLGMHLVLSTQSLQGKLSTELKNNIDLRITLRQNEPGDSLEVLGVPDAAYIPGRLRGRGMILCTKDETRTPRLFQSGYLGDVPQPGGLPPVLLKPVEWNQLGQRRPDSDASPTSAKATDIGRLVQAVVDASASLGVVPPHEPLREPLPIKISLADLPSLPVDESVHCVPFGRIDDPVAQAQPPAVLDLAGTDRVMVAGGPQSGRTTFVRTFLSSVAAGFSADQVHVYVIEHKPSGLAEYDGLPHCGGVFSPAEPDRIRRLVVWLDQEVQRRKDLALAEADRSGQPWIVLIIDGWEYFEDSSDTTFQATSLPTALRKIITAGPPVGVHVVTLGGSEVLSGRMTALYSRRLLLPFPNEEVRRQHLRPRVPTPPLAPGRAVEAATGLQVQLCLPAQSAHNLVTRTATGTASGDRGRARIRIPEAGLDAVTGVAGAVGPQRFPSMPFRVGVDELRRPMSRAGAGWLPLGLGGPSVSPIGIDLFHSASNLLLVSGPPGSGRTTTLATIIAGLRRQSVQVVVVTPPRSPLPALVAPGPDLHLVSGTTVHDDELRKVADTCGGARYALVIDDFEQVSVTPGTGKLLAQEIAGAGSMGQVALVIGGDATVTLQNQQRRSLSPVAQEVAASGVRLLLCPSDRMVARAHGFNLEFDQLFAGPPGRGYLSTDRAASLIQIAAEQL
jgi:S-DNA-T family DNA segregation ATPase FtsK/SpoIIIE